MDLNDLYAKSAAQHQGVSLANGQIVYDVVSLEWGAILSGEAVHYDPWASRPEVKSGKYKPIPPAQLPLVERYKIRLATGDIVGRGRDQLYALPQTTTVGLGDLA